MKVSKLNTQGNITFFIVDLVLILLSSYSGYVYLISPGQYNLLSFKSVFYLNASLLSIVYPMGALSVGLYNSKLREGYGSVARRVFFSIAGTYFLIGLVIYHLIPDLQMGESYLPLVLMVSFVLMIVFRFVIRDEHAFGVKRNRIVILGAGDRASLIERRMRRKVDQKGFDLLGYVIMPNDNVNDQIPYEKRINIDIDKLSKYVEEQDIDCIVIASDERRNVLPVESLFECKIRGVDIMDILDFLEQETGQVAVNLIYPSWIIYSNGFESDNYVRVTFDYVFNFILAAVVLLLTWPFMLLAALFILMDDGYKKGASILYTQERVGASGIPFKIYKFRSMRPDAEKNGAQWATKKDNRTTRVGGFMRKFRIDELPQLINVFKGEMGFVGPRPERPQFVMDLVKKIPYYNQRHNVKPGLTGWAQLKYPYGASTEDSLEKLKYDIYYVKHRSVMLDLFILVRTVEIILFGKGR
jgi:sugar transferase (PEP-CTERM system associated)